MDFWDVFQESFCTPEAAEEPPEPTKQETRRLLREYVNECSVGDLWRLKWRLKRHGSDYDFVGHYDYMYWKHLQSFELCLKNLGQKIYLGDACAYNGKTPGHQGTHSDWLSIDICYPVLSGSPYTQTGYTPIGCTTQIDFLHNLDCDTIYKLSKRIVTVYDNPKILVGESIEKKVMDFVHQKYGYAEKEWIRKVLKADSDPLWKHEPDKYQGGHMHIYVHSVPVWDAEVYWL